MSAGMHFLGRGEPAVGAVTEDEGTPAPGDLGVGGVGGDARPRSRVPPGAELSAEEEQMGRGSSGASLSLGCVKKVAHLPSISGSLGGWNNLMCTLRCALAAPWRTPCGTSAREGGDRGHLLEYSRAVVPCTGAWSRI